jgi:Na+-driven multidrug efflux pump
MGKTLGMGLVGVWIAMIIDWAVRSICFVLRYRSGKWKNTTIA